MMRNKSFFLPQRKQTIEVQKLIDTISAGEKHEFSVTTLYRYFVDSACTLLYIDFKFFELNAEMNYLKILLHSALNRIL